MIQKLQQSRLRKAVGFTLMELLVVTVIISLLTALLLPALSAFKQKAVQRICINNEMQLGLAMKMYVNDYNDTFPGCASSIYGFHPEDWIYWRTNTTLNPPFEQSPILEFMPGAQRSSFRCPMDNTDGDRLNNIP